MSASVAEVLYVINKFRDVKNKAKAIKKITVDNTPVENFKIEKIDLDIDALEISIDYQLPGEEKTSLYARHVFRSKDPDEIKINGKDVSDDRVEFDVDIHLLRADIEYRLDYANDSSKHRVFMLASVDWF